MTDTAESRVDATPISAEEREALAEAIRDLVDRRADSASARAAMTATPRLDRGLWTTLCTEIGVASLPIPEEFGGAGATFAETAAVLEELGRALSPVPVFASALATAAVLLADDADISRALLPDIASGQRIATLCWAGPDGWARPGVTADAGLLTGTADYVLDGESADLLIVLAGGADTATLHAVDATAAGVTVVPLPVVDPSRPLARIEFDEVAAQTISSGPDLTGRLRTLAWALLSAEQVGGAAAALELTVDYTKSRKQFGRIIGSFQALKHRMADMYALVETARSISRAAVAAVASGDPNADELAAAAHVYCSEAFTTVTGEGIQLHGGIGITAEHDIQLYFKRAHGSAQLFGQPHEVVAELNRVVLR
ncbi:acyl-CoA dehydrogenase family protein [Gordonia insulae]|uniref:Putative acyl-CoA dehydrogenase fadE25 n=1 Tax=Gordonia insulae TaxID=2420509 RepID=A0A3G8JLT1_9ACTN|nr:acyl-CoA dehydrogenase family protein [Gordonia insulae]AZG45848.1 putative acyl-CoA dehydrogenase fadE25 [Gordonia insulae]